jgi:hypothetical protein
MDAAEPVADRVSQQEIQRQVDVIEGLQEVHSAKRSIAGRPTAQPPSHGLSAASLAGAAGRPAGIGYHAESTGRD